VEDPFANNPQTGDTFHVNLWFTLLIISCGGFIITAKAWRKQTEAE